MTTNDHTTMNKNAELVPPCFACPKCGQREMDHMICDDDGESVACKTCGTNYLVTQLDQDPPRGTTSPIGTNMNERIREIATVQRKIVEFEIAAAFIEYRVNTGELNSRLIAALERRGHHDIFSPQYGPISIK